MGACQRGFWGKIMNKKVRHNKTTAENLERKFDQGEDVLDSFDLTKASRPLLQKERINLVVPVVFTGPAE